MSLATPKPSLLRLPVLPILCLLYVAWAGAFIYKSSIPLYSGQRVPCLFDDAMISMRYADNLVKGQGLVWNAGERIEGFTNPLQTAIMAAMLFSLPRLAAILAVQVIGVGVVLVTAYMATRVYRQVFRAGESRTASPVVFAGTLGIYTLSYWSVMGMETGLVALFLAASCLMALAGCREDPPRIRHVAGLGVTLSALYLARPDTVAFSGVILAYCLWDGVRAHWSRWGMSAAMLLATIAGYQLFRILYYDAVVPNTALLKLGGFPFGARAANGIGYLLPFVATAIPLAGLAILSCLCSGGRGGVLMLGLFLVSGAYQVYVGGDPWPYWRLLTPALPLLVVLAAEPCMALGRHLSAACESSGTGAGWRSSAVALLLMACVLWTLNLPFNREITFAANPYSVEGTIHDVNAAMAVRELTTSNATVGVFAAGSLPFFSERPAVDFLGKCDRRIAAMNPALDGAVAWAGMFTVPGHNKYDLRYSIGQRQPVFIAGAKWGHDDLSAWASNSYITIGYRGQVLQLLKRSPEVHWGLVSKGDQVVPYVPRTE